MFSYNPKDAKKMFDAGDYQAELTGFVEKTSKTGKPMLEVHLQVYSNGDGPSITLRDWIVNPEGIWKLKALATALGVSDKFENQTFEPEEFRGCSVIASLKVTQSDKYGEQNAVVGYKQITTKSGDPVNFAPAGSIDDEIPFGMLIGFALTVLSLTGVC